MPDVPLANLLADVTTSQIVPIGLIVAGAVLFLVAIWRGQLVGRKPAVPTTTSTATAQQVQIVMRDAEELAGLLAGQMDRQAARLERLIADADARIGRLERLSAEVRAARPADPVLNADPLNQRIFELADEGMPPVEIARTLKQQTGKVQLILALRRK
jgi:hypothetical protein